MTCPRPVIALFLLTFIAAAPSADAADDRPTAIGGGIGVVRSWFAGPFSGGDLRVSVPVGSDSDVEALVAAGVPVRGETIGFYGAQFRQMLPGFGTPRTQPFVTLGVIGVFYHEHQASTISPPILGTVGAGVEHRVGRRFAVRVDVQAIALVVIPLGVRVAAGVSVPVGRLSHGDRAAAVR